jgi:hypothetical protein
MGKLSQIKIKGADSLGNKYNSLQDMWRSELDPTYVKMEREMAQDN